MQRKVIVENVYEINSARLMCRLKELAKIGRNKNGGIDRQLATPADIAARKWLIGCWQKDLGLEVKIDPIANLWGKVPNAGNCKKPIVLGSHHDTVPNGGMFDGALGVLMATEVKQTLQENDVELLHPLEVVSFTGEEPNSFSVSTLGTKVLSGRLQIDDLVKIKDRYTGESLQDAISRLGGDIMQVPAARLDSDSIAGFLECHIEQGRHLFDQQESVAAVTCITGIYREIITITGEANHAGTTCLRNRRDALAAASEVCLAVEDIMRCSGMEDIAATIGRIAVQPNTSNIIPGTAVLTLDLRTADSGKRRQALEKLQEGIQKIAARRHIYIERCLNLDQAEMPMDSSIIEAISDAAAANGEKRRLLVSMAGHDAANMARITKAGMLFVQSVDGYSHCPQEYTNEAEIAKAAQVMLDAVLLLDRRLA
jgi:beta-ureidopropionase / N-carbamoyl-L-amino-acid hydrolase